MYIRSLLASFVMLFTCSAVAAGAEPARPVATAILAGGCFWCVEADFEKLQGVIDAVSGYTGGHVKNPTYEQVSSGRSGHIESVQIRFDPTVISYEQILDYFFRNIDPTRNDGQFCDGGAQYRPAIFYLDETQRQQAESVTRRIDQTKPFPQSLKVELIQATTFYPAEDYHQDYYKKNSLRYNFYRYSCGRDARLKQLWGEPVH